MDDLSADAITLEARCAHCGRDFLLDQLIEGPIVTGKCPWCGEVLSLHYTELLPSVIMQAESAGADLLAALALLTGDGFAFTIHEGSVLEPIRRRLEGDESVSDTAIRAHRPVRIGAALEHLRIVLTEAEEAATELGA
ncbi:MAG: hypothetical protein ACXVQU_09460 [Actinomycetota bacterium]